MGLISDRNYFFNPALRKSYNNMTKSRDSPYNENNKTKILNFPKICNS